MYPQRHWADMDRDEADYIGDIKYERRKDARLDYEDEQERQEQADQEEK